jgi:hypothetical protein
MCAWVAATCLATSLDRERAVTIDVFVALPRILPTRVVPEVISENTLVCWPGSIAPGYATGVFDKQIIHKLFDNLVFL